MANVRSWTVDDVCRWLISINMSSVSTKMEMGGIDGERLLMLNEASLTQQLKITNPSQKVALMAAIDALRGTVVTQRSRTMAPKESRVAPSSERNRASSTGQQNKPARKSSTKATPPLQTVVIAPAPKLLDEYCNHSGWIRKRGGSHKSWKHRYLVVRLGHVYYYENETASKPKGHFSLNGYKVVQCNESDNIKKFPWVFKLLHKNPEERTYYISAAAQHEMKKWMDELNTQIKMLSLSSNFSSGTSQGPVLPGDEQLEDDEHHVYDPVAKEDDEEDDDDDEEEDPYDHVTDDKLYDMVASGEDDDDNDSDYEKIRDDDGNPLVTGGGAPIAPSHSPTHISRTLPALGHTPMAYPKPGSNTIGGGWSLTDHTKPRKGKGDAPTVPPRSLESLGRGQLPSTHPSPHPSPQPPTAHVHPPSAHVHPPPPSHPPPDDDDESSDDGDTYLKLSGDNAVGSSPPTTPDKEPSQKNVIVRGGIEIAVPTIPPKENSRIVVDTVINEAVEEENPYYITLRTAEEVMPTHCVFGPMSRDEAESRLSRTQRLGNYLLRDGTHTDAEKVLSVWSGAKAKHYKLYKEEKGYCLTHGEVFPTIPMLLQHYKTNETLPKSEYYLADPYHPADQ